MSLSGLILTKLISAKLVPAQDYHPCESRGRNHSAIQKTHPYFQHPVIADNCFFRRYAIVPFAPGRTIIVADEDSFMILWKFIICVQVELPLVDL